MKLRNFASPNLLFIWTLNITWLTILWILSMCVSHSWPLWVHNLQRQLIATVDMNNSSQGFTEPVSLENKKELTSSVLNTSLNRLATSDGSSARPVTAICSNWRVFTGSLQLMQPQILFRIFKTKRGDYKWSAEIRLQTSKLTMPFPSWSRRLL